MSTPVALLAAAWLGVALNAVVPWAGNLWAVYARPYGWLWYPDLLQPQVLLLAAAMWPICLIGLGAYGDHSAPGLIAELGRVVLAAGLAGLILVATLALSPLEAPGLVLVVFLVIDVGLLIGVRLALAASTTRRYSKRIFDVIGAAAALAMLWPVMGLVAVAIRLESPGPVLFRQRRLGENGRPFTMLKFRSMAADAGHDLHQAHVARLIRANLSLEELPGSSLKLAGDPRITRVGAFIRRTSLDELPQFFNVLRGQMSLVGPRPPVPYEVELYQDWHKCRLAALPGITGLWQVHGRNRVSFDEMVRMDLEYIERQSFWLDLRLVLETPWAALAGRGAG